jgi:Transposase, Mutator family
MGAALRQRCLIHRARITCWPRCPKTPRSRPRPTIGRSFDLPEDVEPGPKAVAMAQAKIDSYATRWRDSYPAAERCLLDDRDSLTVYLRFPREHWTRVRHSNLIERNLRRDAAAGQGDRPTARRALLPVAGVGGARPRLGRVARVHHDPRRAAAAARPAPQPARPANPTAAK